MYLSSFLPLHVLVPLSTQTHGIESERFEELVVDRCGYVLSDESYISAE